MNEVLYEESAQPKNLKTQKTIYVVYTIFMWISIVFAVFLACIGGLFYVPLLILIIMSIASAVLFWFIRSKTYYCVDCIFVSGSTRIIKVINFKRRKKILIFEAKEVETVGKIGSETFERLYKTPGIKKIYATPNKYVEDGYYVYLTQNGIKYLVCLECKETYLQHLVAFAGRNVIEKDYK